MTNTARGEVTVTLNGVEIKCCATLGALARVEGRTGKPLGRLLSDDLANGSVSVCLILLQETATTQEEAEAVEDTTASISELSDAAVKVLTAAGIVGGGSKKPGKRKARP